MMHRIKKYLPSMKQIAACVIFCTILLQVISGVQRILADVNDTTSTSVNELVPRNSVDVAFVGNSHMFGSVVPLKLFKDYGFSNILSCTASETLSGSLNEMRLIYQKQQPKVIVVEAFKAAHPYLALNLRQACTRYTAERRIQRGVSATNPMKYQMWLEEALRNPEALPYCSTYWTRRQMIYELDKETARNCVLPRRKTLNLGMQAYVNEGTFRLEDLEQVAYDEEKLVNTTSFYTFTEEQLENINLSEENKRALDEMIALAQRHNTELIFTITPYYTNAAEQRIHAQLGEYVTQRGCTYVSENTIRDEIGGPLPGDYSDVGHVAYPAQQRITQFWGKYLTENYPLVDRRTSDDPRYRYWQENCDSLEAQWAAARLQHTEDYQTYLELLSRMDESYLVVLATRDLKPVTLMENAAGKELARLGLNPEGIVEKNKWRYFALLRNGEIQTEVAYNGDALCWEDYIENTSFCASYPDQKNLVLQLGVSTPELRRRCLNMFVYDLVSDTLVDTAYLQVQGEGYTFTHS